MEKKSFFKTKEGGLTIAFIVIMVAFFIIMAGLNMANSAVCMAGFVIMVAAMLYSPVKVYILKPGKQDK
ncbi:hypothetical protein [Faecalicatena contorta]|uniref:hypothetical protein n=1 Tax=Faecalicatena contorta TaxID=39482 RepID=UPI001F2A4DEE|nr:hypothetical protein [Faecalicatena contorta]MCF2555318.1 hypothetical protein [Faecalicatena contorta]MCF2680846.1 hypothetical protein [Faecalicatena contorta]